MPINGTFNGFNIVQMPSTPVPRTVDMTAYDTVAASTSPFTGNQQIQDWQSSWLAASVSLPPLTHAQAQSWIAFLLQVRGQACVFQFGDPLAGKPQGTPSGNPTVNGAGQTGYTLATQAWTPNAAGVLLPGDWLQIGYRLYRNLDIANVDASGNVTLNIWPQLRESPAAGAGIQVHNTTGLWRLSSNQRKWSMSEAKTYGIQFDFHEAI